MEDYFTNAPSPNRYSSFSFSEVGGEAPPRRSHRHHSASSSGSVQYDKSRKLQSENEILRDRVRSCEKGLGKLYQIILTSRKHTRSPPTFTHKRSASMSHQYESHSLTPSPSPIPDRSYHINGHGTEFDDIFGHPPPQVSMPELQSAVEKILSERESLLSELDDLKQITDAAKRERVLAIDEKDQLLRETHSLRVAVESSQAALSNTEEERDVLQDKVHDLQDKLRSLKRDNEKAREMRSLAMEERSKIIAECSELQQELLSFRTERDELYKETLQQQALLDTLEVDKKKLEQDLDWLSKKGCGLESQSRGHKEEKAPPTSKSYDVMEVSLKRINPAMPWGFTFEGGRGMEFFHQDPSIVITGVANHTPAASSLRFGDRVLSFGSQNFSNVTRKEAAEHIRSCDLTEVTLEIGRASANIKPAPEEVKIPGKKDFGFSYETRLFVTSIEEGSVASAALLPGDEILQVQGKSAFNMKPSALKQLLKSCKDGLYLTIQRQPGINLTTLASIPGYRSRQGSAAKLMRDLQETSASSMILNGSRSTQPQRLSSEFTTQSPGTPKSSISESSAGYHSLTHSVPPGESSNAMIPIANEPDSKTGQHGPEQDLLFPSSAGERPSRYLSDPVTPLESGTGGQHSHRLGSGASSSNSISRSSYRNRPSDFYSPRRHTTSASNPTKPGGHAAPKSRTYSMTAYKSAPSIENSRTDHRYPAPRITTPISPGLRPISSTLPANASKAFSMSADNLDSDLNESMLPGVPRPTSHIGSHDKPRPKEGVVHVTTPTSYSRGHLSVSMSNMQTHV